MSVRENSFAMAVSDFDTSLLPPNARQPGTEEFRREVTKILTREFEVFGGWARIVVGNKLIEVTWRQPADGREPIEIAIERLQCGDYTSGVSMLQALRRQSADDPSILYNLGMALSDQGKLVEAEKLLRRLTVLEPEHTNGLVGLGVALDRQSKHGEAIVAFQRAIQFDATNPWAHRNLGACLLKCGKIADAVSHLKAATDLNPADQAAWFGLGQALEASNAADQADGAYIQTIRLAPETQLAEMAKQRRSALGQVEFRKRGGEGGLRMDAVMYCLSALQKFSAMPADQLRRTALEIAVRGEKGFDFNDSTQKYEFKLLSGKFSGLQALAYMYVAFQLIDPTIDMGFDLRKEYNAALNMHQGRAS